MSGKVFIFCAALFLGFALLLIWPPATSLRQFAEMVNKPADIPKPSSRPPRSKSNLRPRERVSEASTYSVSLIDADKNKIPTGTDLFVQGQMYTTHYGPNEDCTWLLIRGHSYVQHGEVDPIYYCRFSVLLTEKNGDGGDLWPSVGLMCDLSPEDFKQLPKLHHYGEEVRVHGFYAASLDFAIGAIPGTHFGVPVLKDCALVDPVKNVARPKGNGIVPILPHGDPAF
jgi:hypothetical protein